MASGAQESAVRTGNSARAQRARGQHDEEHSQVGGVVTSQLFHLIFLIPHERVQNLIIRDIK